MSNYSPYIASVSALINDRAQHYYATRAQQDLGLIIFCVGQAAVMAYHLGIMTRAWMVAVEDSATPALEVEGLPPEPAIDPWVSSLEQPETVNIQPIEIIDTQPQLTPAVDIRIKEQPAINTLWVLNAIAPSVAALSLIKSIEATDRRAEQLLAPATKAKRTRKPKTESTAKPAPKERKAASAAPQKTPTLATFGKYKASID
jgi:hypothetical protein